MEPSSSSVQHHEFLDVFLQPFFYNQKAENYVEESSGKKDSRRTCGDEIKASKFGIKKPEHKTIPSLDSGPSYSQVNQGLGRNSVFTSAKRSVRTESNPTVCSQECQGDDNPYSSAGRSVREMSEHSSAWRTTIFKSPTIKTSESLTKVRQKLNRSEEDQTLDQKGNALKWGLFVSTTMKAAVLLGHIYNDNLIAYRNTNFRRAQNVVRHHAEVDLGPETRESECSHDRMAIYTMDEICFTV